MEYKHLDEELRVEGERYSAIVTCKDKILLIFRKYKGKEYYCLPGGHRQKDEKPEVTVVREIKEETNIDISNPKLVLKFTHYFDQTYNEVFLASVDELGKPEIIGEEKDLKTDENYMEVLWFDIEKVPGVVMYPETVKEYIVNNLVKNKVKILPVKPTIKFEDLEKVDIRVGLIERVSDVQGSDKLVKLNVDFGDHRRTILVGMKKEREDVQEIVGKKALFVVNLDPRKMAGEVSEGMIFDIGYSNEITPVLAVVEKDIPQGTSAG